MLTTSGYFGSSPSSHSLVIAESELASIEQELIDFGDCAAIPADQSMLDYYAADDLSRVDVLMLDCVIYPIATCKVGTRDCLGEGSWPTLDEWPKDITCRGYKGGYSDCTQRRNDDSDVAI